MTVFVKDINDERPQFTQSLYEFTLNANMETNNTKIDVGSVFAVDLDKEDQGNLRFELIGADAANFSLEKRGFGECAIFMPSDLVIDGKEFDFQIKVTDLVGHTNETDVIVRVHLWQLFDELKWSQEEAYSSSILENSPPGTQLIGVSAFPVGLFAGAKYVIGYKLAEPSTYYVINNVTGVITTSANATLDREEPDAYKRIEQSRIYVQAYMDLDKVRYWSTVKQVNVDVLDANDEWPLFAQPTDNHTQVFAHPARFFSIFNFSAIDGDLEDRVTYSLVDQQLVFSNITSLNLPFKINPRNGTLSFVPRELNLDDLK